MPAKLYSIAPGLPFLATLAERILDGGILPGHDFRADPLALAALTILVPTRRAARALGQEFARALGGRAALLPTIRTLGDAETAGQFSGGSSQDAPATLIATIDPLERRILIARFVRQWKTQITDGAGDLRGGEMPVLPASSADALWLAGDLARLFDEIETEGATLDQLAGLAPDRLAGWWQLTTTFLEILTRHWPAVLAERGVVDEAGARIAWLRAEAARLAERGSPVPVVIAGSTATAPAALALMRAVASLPNGALVLPGLDRHMEERGFDAVGVSVQTASAPGHPQYALKRILAGLLVPREAADHFAPADDHPLSRRERFVSDALRPASTTDRWGEVACRHPPDALDGLAVVEAENEREEALAIAVAMRDALGDPQKTVALVTPDRSLARRVVAELERFDVSANDSAGRPLAATAPGTLVSLALGCALRPGDPIALVSLLKHPLLRLGLPPADARRAARAIEILALRGNVGVADAAAMSRLLARTLADPEKGTATGETGKPDGAQRIHPSRAARLVAEADRELAAQVASRLEAALAPLTALRGAPETEIGPQAIALTRSLEALAADGEGTPASLYATETGAALAAFLAALVGCPETGFRFAPSELPDVVAALVAGQTVRPRGGLSGRAFVWGALEARLQHVDTVILGGLNEGTWPHRAVGDAFLSRVMRAEIRLDPPERLIGLAAHDFQMALGMPRVVMTRATRAGGAPAIASRWLQRILTLAGEAGTQRLRREGEVFLHHARRLDRAEADAPRAARPAPVPPLAKRPAGYSVTEIERLIRDPYAVHARRVLKLEPFPELMRAPGAADRGNLFHAILADYAGAGNDPAAPDAADVLLAIASERFKAEGLPPEVEAVWWPRMETLAGTYIEWERARATRVRQRLVETRGEIALPGVGTKLKGYADRIDVLDDGSVEIIDFKTGSTPSVRQARVLLAPQLPLEGAMARLGAFADTGGPVERVAELAYLRLRERDLEEETLSNTDRRTGEHVSADDLSDAALAKVTGLAAAYRDPEKAFMSRTRPFRAGDFSGDYDHLARAREWAVGADEEGAGE